MHHPIVQGPLDAAGELKENEAPPRRPMMFANGDNIARIVFKDEGRDEEGRLIGPAYAENSAGGMAINYGWVTWREAERLATALGVDFQEV